MTGQKLVLSSVKVTETNVVGIIEDALKIFRCNTGGPKRQYLYLIKFINNQSYDH